MSEPLHRVEVPVSPDNRDAVTAVLVGLGARGVWEQPGFLVVWLERPEATTDARLTGLAAGPITTRPEPDRDWQAAWKATIRPVHAGRTVVVPTWLADEHEPGADELTLVLDPGQAFGTGHHATTALCLELLDELDLAGRLAGRRVVDVGCGSGILAIAAAARGAEAVGIDLDPDAVAVTRANAARNNVTVAADVGAVEDLAVTGEVVVANLISDVVRVNAAALVAAASELLVVSGITEERAEEVLAALTANGAEVVDVRRRDGWVAASLVPARRGGGSAPPSPRRDDRRGRLGRIAGGLLIVGLLVGACSEPEVLDPATDDAEEEAPAAAAPSPEQAMLLTEVSEMAALVAQVDAELTAAADAEDLTDLRAAVARADALLVADPAVGTRAVFPSQALERNEERAAPDALNDTLGAARVVGGALGRSVVETLRDPIAGDLGSWERDAPGVIENSRAAAAGVDDEAAAADRILELIGEGPRAIAWLALAAGTDDLTLARAAVLRAGEHLGVIAIALDLAVEPLEPGAPPTDPDPDAPNEELGPGIDPDELEDGAAAASRGTP